MTNLVGGFTEKNLEICEGTVKAMALCGKIKLSQFKYFDIEDILFK